MGKAHIKSLGLSQWQGTKNIIQSLYPLQTKTTSIWLYKSSVQGYNRYLNGIVFGYLINCWQPTHIASFNWHKIHSAIDQLYLVSSEGKRAFLLLDTPRFQACEKDWTYQLAYLPWVDDTDRRNWWSACLRYLDFFFLLFQEEQKHSCVPLTFYSPTRVQVQTMTEHLLIVPLPFKSHSTLFFFLFSHFHHSLTFSEAILSSPFSQG